MSASWKGRDRPTMADVAERAGVSKMTVSRVLNGHDVVAAETAERVRRAVADLNYVRSHRARSLALGKTHVLGMIVLDISSEWIWPLVQGAGRQAEELGYQVLLRTTGTGDVASFEVDRTPLGSDLLDGLVIVSWLVPLSYSEQLARKGFPVVLVDAYELPAGVSWIGTEDFEGARRAAQHLVGLGHERLALISGGADPVLARERREGFLDGMAAGGIPERSARVVHGDFTRESGYRIGMELLAGSNPPTAIFASNDLMAIGVLNAARELGVEVPGSLSVVGFDDIGSARHALPPLTTIARPYGQMGARAVQHLIELIGTEAGAREAIQLKLPTRLVVRESTAPPRARLRE